MGSLKHITHNFTNILSERIFCDCVNSSEIETEKTCIYDGIAESE
jgi:hypothetical protein